MITPRPRPRSSPMTTRSSPAQSNLANLEATEASSGGTYTSLPKVGDLISEDQPVYAVDGVKVPLLYGSLAAYRAFYVGMSDGADVGQLTHDLIALGYGAGLTQTRPLLVGHRGRGGTLADRPRPARHRDGPVGSGGLRARPHPGHVGHPSVGQAGAARGTSARRHQHHPDRHRRPGRDPGVPAQAGRSGHRRAARRRHHRRRQGGDRSATWPSARAAAAPAPGTAPASADQTPCSSSGSGIVVDPDGHRHHHPGQHPARRHLGPGAGERQHHHPASRQRPGRAGERPARPRRAAATGWRWSPVAPAGWSG